MLCAAYESVKFLFIKVKDISSYRTEQITEELPSYIIEYTLIWKQS